MIHANDFSDATLQDGKAVRIVLSFSISGHHHVAKVFEEAGRWLKLVMALLALALPFTSSAAAQEEKPPIEVSFTPGLPETVLRGRFAGDRGITYTVAAEAGDTLTASLSPSNSATYFNVYRPGSGPGDEAMANASMTGPMVKSLNRFSAVLPTSGVYTIQVYLFRSAARRHERTAYTLRIAVLRPQGSAGRPVQGDFADGLAGGPDFLRVARLSAGDRLNIRAEPSARAAIIAHVQNGDRLRNLGCRIREGMRWCRVETETGATGWGAGRFLIEGAQP